MKTFLDFFAVPDWFGRPEPYGASIERGVMVSICLFACIFLPILLKKKGEDATKKALLGLWISALTLDVMKYIFYNAYCVVNHLEFSAFELPLWTCSIYLFVLPISLFCKNQKVKDACNGFLCSISMIGGFINFLFPTESVFSFMGLHTLLYHFILLITPIIMLVTGYYKPKFHHFVGASSIFVLYGIPVFIFDNIFAQDYMFIYDGTWFGPMADFAALMPHRLVWTVVCVAGHIAVSAGILYLAETLSEKQKA